MRRGSSLEPRPESCLYPHTFSIHAHVHLHTHTALVVAPVMGRCDTMIVHAPIGTAHGQLIVSCAVRSSVGDGVELVDRRMSSLGL